METAPHLPVISPPVCRERLWRNYNVSRQKIDKAHATNKNIFAYLSKMRNNPKTALSLSKKMNLSNGSSDNGREK